MSGITGAPAGPFGVRKPMEGDRIWAIEERLTNDQAMTDNQTLAEPLSAADAKQLAVQILETGSVQWWDHFKRRLSERGMTTLDVENIIKGGWVDQIEPVTQGPWYGCWRYRFTTREMAVVIQFASASEMAGVTAWRL